jgi:hypothetical protein
VKQLQIYNPKVLRKSQAGIWDTFVMEDLAR